MMRRTLLTGLTSVHMLNRGISGMLTLIVPMLASTAVTACWVLTIRVQLMGKCWAAMGSATQFLTRLR
jgi:hypothetical protein